jgi:RNA-binding protein 5/10
VSEILENCRRVYKFSSLFPTEIMFRNLDALTNEEKVLTALQERIPEQVSKVSKILICRDPLTQISRGICYLNFENLVDSMNTFQALERLESPLQIENRDGEFLRFFNGNLLNFFVLHSVTFSYCIDSENRNIGRPSTGNNNRRDNNNQMQQNSSSNDQQHQQQSTYSATNNHQYTYTLADVAKLAEQAANMYAQNPTEKESYIQYYTDFYTKQISQVSSSSLVIFITTFPLLQGLNTSMPNYTQYEAHSGASIAQSAIERKHKMKSEPAPPGAMFPAQQVETPKGNDGKKYRNNFLPKMSRSSDHEIKLMIIMIFSIGRTRNSPRISSHTRHNTLHVR